MPVAQTPTSVFGPLQSWLHSPVLHAAAEATVIAVVVLYLATVVRVHRDARRRLGSRWLAALVTLGGIALPFVGVLLWLLVRPPEPRLEVRQRELEILAFESALGRS